MTLAQILALVIFLAMFGVIMWGKVHRYIPALIGAALVIVIVFLIIMRDARLIAETFNFGQLGTGKFWYPGHEPIESKGVNWQTIIFIAGMMLMVEGLAKVGFFRWMCLYVARLVKFKVVPILVAFTVLSGFLSMFIDSITVMLFLASVTIEMGRLLKFDPVPIIIAEIFASNTGGSATMSGDPPNIIIGTALGLTFMDFIENAGMIAWVGMVVAVIFFYFAFRKILVKKSVGAMVPVIGNLASASALPIGPLAYTLALGTDIGGNATPIGASANVVGTAIAEREGFPISWGRYCKYCVPSTVIVVAVCWALVTVKYVL